MTTAMLPPEQLSPNPWDPRSSRNPEAIREMAESILKVGLLQPLLVRPAGDGRYQMAFGMTRWEAIKLLAKEGQWTGGIPCEIRELSDAEMATVSLVENSQRQDLTPLEKVRAYQHALDTIPELTITALADSLGVDRSTLSNNLRLLHLPYVVLERVESGEMSAHAAREFLCLVSQDHAHEDIMESIIKEVANTRLGAAPDWRGDNIRRLIRERVRGSTVEHWRRLGTLEGTTHRWPDYGNSHKTDPLFDVAAFQKELPERVHLIPWDDSEPDDRGYRVMKEFTLAFTCEVKEWERRQAASKRTEATGEGAKPPSGQELLLKQALEKDPVARKMASQAPAVSTETPQDTVPVARVITPGQKEKLGSRAKVVKLSGYKGFHRTLSQRDYRGPPVYFPELDECLKRCTKGATYCQEWSEELSLHCLNEKCWNEKEARGKAEFKKTVEARAAKEDAEDQEMAEAIVREITDSVARPVATALILCQGHFESYAPDGLSEFAYEPRTMVAIRRLLSLPGPGKGSRAPRGASAWGKDEMVPALEKVPADRLPELAAQLLVYTLRLRSGKLKNG